MKYSIVTFTFSVLLFGFPNAALAQQDNRLQCTDYPYWCQGLCFALSDSCLWGSPELACDSAISTLESCRLNGPLVPGTPVIIPPKPEPEPVVTYHAGTCKRALGGLPSWMFTDTISHDDVQSYKMVDGTPESKRESGFYAVDMVEAVINMSNEDENGEPIYTLGEHLHDTTSTCTLPEVDEAKFDSIRSRAQSIKWTKYHLLKRNCQHWATLVVSI